MVETIRVTSRITIVSVVASEVGASFKTHGCGQCMQVSEGGQAAQRGVSGPQYPPPNTFLTNLHNCHDKETQ